MTSDITNFAARVKAQARPPAAEEDGGWRMEDGKTLKAET
jgi:hypothetical protein